MGGWAGAPNMVVFGESDMRGRVRSGRLEDLAQDSVYAGWRLVLFGRVCKRHLVAPAWLTTF